MSEYMSISSANKNGKLNLSQTSQRGSSPMVMHNYSNAEQALKIPINYDKNSVIIAQNSSEVPHNYLNYKYTHMFATNCSPFGTISPSFTELSALPQYRTLNHSFVNNIHTSICDNNFYNNNNNCEDESQPNVKCMAPKKIWQRNASK